VQCAMCSVQCAVCNVQCAMCNDMKEYIILGGVNGVGKSSFKGILLEQQNASP